MVLKQAVSVFDGVNKAIFYCILRDRLDLSKSLEKH